MASGQPGSPTNPTTVVSARRRRHRYLPGHHPDAGRHDVITAAATGRAASGWAQVTVTAAYSSASDAYNDVGITDNGNTTPGDFDGVGDSYSAQALASATPNSLTPARRSPSTTSR